MKTSEIRQKYLDFFASKEHQVVPSSSLIPGNDPTLMFTVAGMVQFKDVFLGFEKRNYTRAVTSQKCLRAGGKHNDLENVGYTARHHTFFEMLGNFSFGDYFKHDAITFAWEFLTSPHWLALPTERLLVTVYASDNEAYDIWHKTIGLPAQRIIRIGDNKGAPYASDNFWAMGDTGPCGPCTEIFYDHGDEVAGGPPGSEDEDGDRFMEIWNNVFMEFNRDESGTMHPLPKPSVDTGMGLERISTVLQHVKSNYETDGLACLVQAAARETGVPYSQNVPSLKVIADHIRACCFMISDGILPSNEGRGYVLRRIARRAIRHGYKLGQKHPFFYKLTTDLVKEMGGAYPELREKQALIEATLLKEETRFAETLENGMTLVEEALAKGTLDGETLFKLYDTFGFPIDLTADICREKGVTVDLDGFERAMQAQRARGRAHSQFKIGKQLNYTGPCTEFHGYDTETMDSTVAALYKDQEIIDVLQQGEEGIIVLSQTPFYAEGGGQVGETGDIIKKNGLGERFHVTDTQKIQADVYGHQGKMEHGQLRLGDTVTAVLDLPARLASARNHSATHLLHSALRHILGSHVQQKGSLVTPQRTRFDFTHPEPVRDDQLREIEQLVNQMIGQNLMIQAEWLPIEEAKTAGAMALFGEKYSDVVRVLSMGEFSKELCGGIHVKHTGDIGLFKIVSETGIAAGVRRIEAVTGNTAIQVIQTQETTLKEAAFLLKANGTAEVPVRIESLTEQVKILEKETARLKAQITQQRGGHLADKTIPVGKVQVLAQEIPQADNATLRQLLDQLKDKLGTAVIVLASQQAGKVMLVAGVTANLNGQIHAGELVNMVAQQVGGKGGGRPDMAQAGGTQPEQLTQALASVVDWVKTKLP